MAKVVVARIVAVGAATQVLVGIGIACVILGREICDNDFNCAGKIEPKQWSDSGLQGQWVVLIGTIIVFFYFLIFGILDVCGRRTGKIELVLSVISTLLLGAAAGAEFYYGIFFYQYAEVNALVTTIQVKNSYHLVQSWIAAGAAYALAAMSGLSDVIVVLRGY